MFLVNEIITLLAANLILMQALGTSTLFIAAGSRRNLIGTAAAITIFTTIGSAAACMINSLLDGKYQDFLPLFYTIAIGIIYVLLLTLLYFFSEKAFKKSKKYIHLSAFNCAVMGTLFTITESDSVSAEKFGLSDYLSCGFEAGVGFIIAALFLTAAFRRLNSSKVPSSFRGFPAMLVYLGIISMAVYALK
jgi:electron transport complex protein RnfA